MENLFMGKRRTLFSYIFFKKVAKMFGRFKKITYLCIS